jgi:hypothetical protein
MKLGRILTRLIAILCLSVVMTGGAAYAAASKSGSGTGSTSTTSSQTPTGGGGSVQGYAADKALQIGTVVQLEGGSTAKVAPATSKNLNQMYGVVVDPHQLSLTISDSSLANESYVATSGTYDVLVSNQAGPIKSGDFVTLSAIDGVAMKAGTDESTVLGRAAGGFTGKSGVGSIALKNVNGQQTQTVTLGMVPVAIDIQRNPNKKSTKADVPKPLQRIGQAIAEKPVSAVRIYLSVAITVLCIIIAITVLWAGIRNSIIAIGRNPLSKKSIFRGLLEIVLTSFLILIIGLFTVYLLLKL